MSNLQTVTFGANPAVSPFHSRQSTGPETAGNLSDADEGAVHGLTSFATGIGFSLPPPQ